MEMDAYGFLFIVSSFGWLLFLCGRAPIRRLLSEPLRQRAKKAEKKRKKLAPSALIFELAAGCMRLSWKGE